MTNGPTPKSELPGHGVMLAALRDSIALEVLKAVLANPKELLQHVPTQKGDSLENVIARWSYATADAMLAERSRTGT